MLPENIKVLIDLCIGNGNITLQNSKNGSYTIGHSIKQAAYAKHKAELLRSYGFNAQESIYTASTGKNKGSQLYRVYIPACPIMHTAHKWLYNKGRKALDRALFRHLDERTLAYWFMDDGSAKTTQYLKQKNSTYYIYDRRKTSAYMFATDSFTQYECVLMQDWLNTKFGLDSILAKDKNNFRVAISKQASKDKFRAIVEPYIIESMRYKISYAHGFEGIPFIRATCTPSAAEQTERSGLLNTVSDSR